MEQHNHMQHGLACENLSFAYPRNGKRWALKGVSAYFGAGRATALIGFNGAGKSTLCKVLNGILRTRSGRILLDGVEVRVADRPGSVVAYSFQNPDDQLFQPTVARELAFGPRSLRLAEAVIEAGVSLALDLFDLRSFAASHPLDLPFVLRKRVAMAAVIAMQRPFTVLDEPTVAQDPAFRRRLIASAKSLLAHGTGLIIISHDPEFVFEVCDAVVVMSGGKCCWAGSRETFLASELAEVQGFLNVPARLSRATHVSPILATQAAVTEHWRGRDIGEAAG
jgi:energy-coupling factor transport system ATP-binding protein